MDEFIGPMFKVEKDSGLVKLEKCVTCRPREHAQSEGKMRCNSSSIQLDYPAGILDTVARSV